jgi:hypothetical protein
VTEAHDELPVQMLSVGRAAAVAAPEDFAAHADGKDHLRGDLVQYALLVVEGLDNLKVLGQRCLKNFGPFGGGFCHVFRS